MNLDQASHSKTQIKNAKQTLFEKVFGQYGPTGYSLAVQNHEPYVLVLNE